VASALFIQTQCQGGVRPRDPLPALEPGESLRARSPPYPPIR
jgi:hypothetical protein